MIELIIYIVLLLCIAVHPKHFTIMWGGLSSTTTSVQHPLYMSFLHYNYIYAFADVFMQRDLHGIAGLQLIASWHAFLGNRTHGLSVASAMLNLLNYR